MEQEKKGWFAGIKDKFKTFCTNHPDVVLTVLGGTFALAGACVNYATTKNEYKDQVYLTDGDDVYRLPAKAMHSKKLNTIK